MITDDYNIYTLLLPMVGENNGTVIQDFAKNNLKVSVVGNTKTSTAQSKFYDSSAYFNGTTDFLQIPQVLFDTNDFTISAWININSITDSQQTIFSQRLGSIADGRVNFAVNSSASGGVLFLFIGSTTSLYLPAGAVSTNQWHHVAATRESNIFRIFLNGFLANTSSLFTQAVESADSYIGSYYSTDSFFGGYIQDFLIISGAALWTADFTPPDALAFYLNGTIKDENDVPCQRTVFSVAREYPSRVFSTQSDPVTGAYSLLVPSLEQSVVVLHSGSNLRNDLVKRVLPG